MARQLLSDSCETARVILAGELDADLDSIAQAVSHRQRVRFRKGARVRLVGTRNPELDGRDATVLRVNAKTITVGVGELRYEDWDGDERFPYYEAGEFNVSPSLLEVV